MSTSSTDSDKQSPPPDKSTVVLLIGTIGDTTWRMFVPTIGLTVSGLLLDRYFNTTPWLTIAGIVCGTLAATLLIRNQLKKVNTK